MYYMKHIGLLIMVYGWCKVASSMKGFWKLWVELTVPGAHITLYHSLLCYITFILYCITLYHARLEEHLNQNAEDVRASVSCLYFWSMAAKTPSPVSLFS